MTRYQRLWDDRLAGNDNYTIRISGEYMLAGNSWLPTWVEIEVNGHNEPNLFARVEIRDDVPRLVELGWRASEHQREIRQKDLREQSVATILDDVYAMTIIEVRDGEAVLNVGAEGSEQDQKMRDLLEELRVGKGKRRISTELLRQVADVYRANIDQAPTEAVARTFGVRSRMASSYVQRARERDFLPPTTQGKKQA